MNPTVTIRPERADLTLSTKLNVTVTVEGQAPLRVELPKALLAGNSAQVWNSTLTGPARRIDLPDGKQRWTQEFVLDPFAPGQGQLVEFTPLTVNGISADIPAVTINVTTSLESTGEDQIRNVTSIEPTPWVDPQHSYTWLWFGSAAFVLILVAIIVKWKWRSRKPVELTPDEWLKARLANLNTLPTEERVDAIAGACRGWIQRRYAIPAESLTTVELEDTLRQTWPEDRVKVVEEVLGKCDRVKFAQTTLTVKEVEQLRGNVLALCSRDAAQPAYRGARFQRAKSHLLSDDIWHVENVPHKESPSPPTPLPPGERGV